MTNPRPQEASQQNESVQAFLRDVRRRLGDRLKPTTWIRIGKNHRYELQDLAVRLIAQFGQDRAAAMFVERFEASAWTTCASPTPQVGRREAIAGAMQRRRQNHVDAATVQETALAFLHERLVIDATGDTRGKRQLVQGPDGTIDVLATAELHGFVRPARDAEEEQDARWAAGEIHAQHLRREVLA